LANGTSASSASYPHPAATGCWAKKSRSRLDVAVVDNNRSGQPVRNALVAWRKQRGNDSCQERDEHRAERRQAGHLKAPDHLFAHRFGIGGGLLSQLAQLRLERASPEVGLFLQWSEEARPDPLSGGGDAEANERTPDGHGPARSLVDAPDPNNAGTGASPVPSDDRHDERKQDQSTPNQGGPSERWAGRIGSVVLKPVSAALGEPAERSDRRPSRADGSDDHDECSTVDQPGKRSEAQRGDLHPADAFCPRPDHGPIEAWTAAALRPKRQP
jgi:hypothetical protein